MSAPDDLETLLSEVRKTINDNSQFLKKLGDESMDDDLQEDDETVPSDESFEEL